MRKNRLLDLFLRFFRILFPICILVPLVFFSYRLIDGRMEDLANIGNQDYHSGLGLFIFASHIVLFGINAILVLLGGIGWLVSQKCKSLPNQEQHILVFRFLTFAPMISHLVYCLINVIVVNVG